MKSLLVAVFQPSTFLMARLKYVEKFLLVSVLFVLPLATVLYAYVTDTNTQIDFTHSELDGTRYLRVANTLFADVQRARLDDKAAQARLNADLSALLAIDAELGDSLKTSDAMATLKTDARAALA